MSRAALVGIGVLGLLGTAVLGLTDPFEPVGPELLQWSDATGAERSDLAADETCSERERRVDLPAGPGWYRLAFEVRGSPDTRARVGLYFTDAEGGWIRNDGVSLIWGRPPLQWRALDAPARAGGRASGAFVAVSTTGCGPDLQTRSGSVRRIRERTPWTAGWWLVGAAWLGLGLGAAREALPTATSRSAGLVAIALTAIAAIGMALPPWLAWWLVPSAAAGPTLTGSHPPLTAALALPDYQVLGHGIVFAVLALAWLRAWPPRATALGLGLLAPLTELLQGCMLHGRGAQLADLLADWAGIAVVLALAATRRTGTPGPD